MDFSISSDRSISSAFLRIRRLFATARYRSFSEKSFVFSMPIGFFMRHYLQLLPPVILREMSRFLRRQRRLHTDGKTFFRRVEYRRYRRFRFDVFFRRNGSRARLDDPYRRASGFISDTGNYFPRTKSNREQ